MFHIYGVKEQEEILSTEKYILHIHFILKMTFPQVRHNLICSLLLSISPCVLNFACTLAQVSTALTNSSSEFSVCSLSLPLLTLWHIYMAVPT